MESDDEDMIGWEGVLQRQVRQKRRVRVVHGSWHIEITVLINENPVVVTVKIDVQ